MVYQEGLAGRLKCLKYWLGRVLRETARGSAEDREAVASTRASDAVVFGHGQGRRNFRRFLARSGVPELGERLAVVPFAIGASFLDCPVPVAKDDLVVAIGRWDDPQKHPARLAAALARFLAGRAGTEVVVFGRGSERFAPVARRFPALSIAGVQPQDAVARALARARSIVFSSRWEGSPHAALEALALGATLVGPPIASLASWTEDGRYGTVARSRRASSLARALSGELAAWDEGTREPREIARQWRARLAPEVVCRRLLEALRT
jgi:glycosyltransferase involved in cell wall biosynthesis